MHRLVPSLAKVVDFRRYRLNSTSTQVFGIQETCIDTHLKWFRDVAADFVMFVGSRPITLLKFFKHTKMGLYEAHVSESMDVVMFGRLVPKEASCLYSF